MTRVQIPAQVFSPNPYGICILEQIPVVLWTCRGSVYLMIERPEKEPGSLVTIVPLDPRSMKQMSISYALSHHKYTLPSDKELLDLAGTMCVVPKGTLIDLLHRFFEYDNITDLLF